LPITLTANDPEDDPLTYTIASCPLHGTLVGRTPNLIYTPNPGTNGSDSFTFKVNDGTNDSNTATVSITVNAVYDALLANAGSNQTVTDIEGDGTETIILDGSASSDTEGTIISYSWTESGSGIATGESPGVSFSVGSHTVTLEVTDDDGATATDTVLITVNGQMPMAEFSAGPLTGEAPLNVAFTDLSTGNLTSWLWDFGDGESSTMESPTHIYQAGGIYTVTLTVTNAQGETTEIKSNYVTIVDTAGPTTSNFTFSPNPTTSGELTTFTATASDVAFGNSNIVAAEGWEGPDPGEGNATIVDVADGAFDSPTEGLIFTIPMWAPPGSSFTIFVRSQDGSGNWGTPASVVVNVQ